MYKYLKRFVQACRLHLQDEWERRYSTWRRYWYVVSLQWTKMYPADRRQIRAILFLLVVVLTLLKVVPEKHAVIYSDKEKHAALLAWEQQQLVDSISHREKMERRFQNVRATFRLQDSLRRKKWKQRTKQFKKRSLALASFDPNKVDSASLVEMGIAEWMAANLIRYRAAGKLFKHPEELRALYGMTPALYDSIIKYVTIDTTYVQQRLAARRDSCQILITHRSDNQQLIRPLKLQAGEHVDLNHADTTLLQRIPGVGSKIAQMIVRYREQLGGYVSVRQVRDIYLNDTLLGKWVVVDETCVHKLSINHSSVMTLKKHPYCSYLQAKAIVDYRKRFGVIHNTEEMSYIEGISISTIDKWKPYLDFTP